MPERLTPSKKVYQQEEFSVKPREKQKYLSKTLAKKKRGERNSHIITVITRKLTPNKYNFKIYKNINI